MERHSHVRGRHPHAQLHAHSQLKHWVSLSVSLTLTLTFCISAVSKGRIGKGHLFLSAMSGSSIGLVNAIYSRQLSCGSSPLVMPDYVLSTWKMVVYVLLRSALLLAWTSFTEYMPAVDVVL